MLVESKMGRTAKGVEPEASTSKKVTATKASKSAGKCDAGCDFNCTWNIIDVLSETVQWDQWAVDNTVRLLDDDNTVPFIARYRKERTLNMEADKIRQVKEDLDTLRAVQAKVKTVYNAVEKLGKITPQLRNALSSAQSLSEVEHLYAPFKPGGKRTLAERARELGLEPTARKLLTEPWMVNLNQHIRPDTEGLTTLKEIKAGIQHIVADIFSKDKAVMDSVRQWCKNANVQVKSTKVKAPAKAKVKCENQKGGGDAEKSQNEADKFHLYFDFSCNIKTIRPHQVLAINRGVAKKLLTMKVVIPDWVETQVQQLGERMFVHHRSDRETRQLVTQSVKDAFSRLIEPLIVRHFKGELTKTAEKASIEVFASNLKRLLLTPPVRGKIVLGVDPGFKHGCKYAVVSITGQVMDSGVFYPHGYSSDKRREMNKIVQVVLNHRCETVAIGNGTACRETEAAFSDLIKQRAFMPLRVMFCIVSESGASIYSASPEAVKEMPDLDVSIRGAVSIARRLQDPMAELVKIEPKHIGVGMYQHDLGESQLKVALDGVVEDCVSFVGVDLNVASEVLLRRIAGLSTALAKKVIAHREKDGPFINRQQLSGVKGLGPKTFKQCAGFVRVLSLTRGSGHHRESKVEDEAADPPGESGRKRNAGSKAAGSKSKKAKLAASLDPNPLDMTSIHPESYDAADRVISMIGLDKENIGSPGFIERVKRYVSTKSGQTLDTLAAELDVGVPTLTLIVQALQQTVGHDMREEFEKPLFKEGVRNFSDLKLGDQLTGRVTNTVHFGAFVDVGVGRDGLIHSSQIHPQRLNGRKGLELGDKVKVTVQNVDFRQNRLGLRLESLLT